MFDLLKGVMRCEHGRNVDKFRTFYFYLHLGYFFFSCELFGNIEMKFVDKNFVESHVVPENISCCACQHEKVNEGRVFYVISGGGVSAFHVYGNKSASSSFGTNTRGTLISLTSSGTIAMIRFLSVFSLMLFISSSCVLISHS